MGCKQQAAADWSRAIALTPDAERRKAIEAQLRRLPRSRAVTVAGSMLVFFWGLSTVTTIGMARLEGISTSLAAGLIVLVIFVVWGLVLVAKRQEPRIKQA